MPIAISRFRGCAALFITVLTVSDALVRSAFAQVPTSRGDLGQKFSPSPLSLDSPTFKPLYISADLGSKTLRFGHVDMAICGSKAPYTPKPCNAPTGLIGATHLVIPDRIPGTLLETWVQNVGGVDIEPANREGQSFPLLHVDVEDSRTISLTTDLTSMLAARIRIYFVIAVP